MTFQTFTGKQYLKIDVANNYGLDKEDWDDRIAWFDANEHQLEQLLKQAEEPALYYAGVLAWRKTQKGEACGYPISLDATSSGIQLLACLTGDRLAARLCNVVDTGKREDAYTGLYHQMVAKVGDNAKIDRKETKKAIMTAFYNSTAMPKKVFGEGPLLSAFYETMAENAPGPWELTEIMLGIWDPTVDKHNWVMPDNFHVEVKVIGQKTEVVHFLNEPFDVSYSVNMPVENGRSLLANMTHSTDGMVVREMRNRCGYNPVHIANIKRWMVEARVGTSTSRDNDKLVMKLVNHYKESGFLSTRILSYLDAANMGHVPKNELFRMVNSLPAKPFNILAVHDCFRCLPNYGNDLRKQYNIILSEIARSDLLSNLVSQIIKRKVTVNKYDNDLHYDILEANYALS